MKEFGIGLLMLLLVGFCSAQATTDAIPPTCNSIGERRVYCIEGDCESWFVKTVCQYGGYWRCLNNTGYGLCCGIEWTTASLVEDYSCSEYSNTEFAKSNKPKKPREQAQVIAIAKMYIPACNGQFVPHIRYITSAGGN